MPAHAACPAHAASMHVCASVVTASSVQEGVMEGSLADHREGAGEESVDLRMQMPIFGRAAVSTPQAGGLKSPHDVAGGLKSQIVLPPDSSPVTPKQSPGADIIALMSPTSPAPHQHWAPADQDALQHHLAAHTGHES